MYYLKLVIFLFSISFSGNLFGQTPKVFIEKPINSFIWQSDSTRLIVFATAYVQSVKLEYSTNSGNSWLELQNPIQSDSNNNWNVFSINWKIPRTPSKYCRLRVSSLENPMIFAISVNFEITDKEIIGEFPLEIGNKWFYGINSYTNIGYPHDTSSAGIYYIWEVKDSLKLADGFNYFRILIYKRNNIAESFNLSDSCFIRQYLNTVNGIFPGLGSFSQSFLEGSVDTFNIMKIPLLRVNKSGQNFTYFSFVDRVGCEYYDYWVNQYGYSRKLLTGCLINGNVYGEILTDFIVSINNNDPLPQNYFLSQNYPNPFNPVTKINYSIPQSSRVKITIYNILGQVVADLVNEEKFPGNYFLNWDASKVASGIYICRIVGSGSTQNFVKSIKMVYLK